MTLVAFGDRLVTGLLIGLAGFGVVALGAMQVGVDVPAVALPVTVAVGLAWRRRSASPPTSANVPLALAVVLGLLVLAVVAAVAYGAVATPSRHWDGAAAWDLKARHLTEDLTLEQPFFADPRVLVHSRAYPLLQPLLVAAGNRLFGMGWGRLVFPVLFGTLALLVGVGLRRAGATGIVAWLSAAGCVLAPRLANPTSGGADSGYADLFLLVATTALAVGLLLRDGRLLVAGAALAVMVKPEGMVYAGLAIAVCWCAGDRHPTMWVTLGWMVGALAWLPVQHRLQNPDGGSSVGSWLLPLAVTAVALGADLLARHLRLPVRARVVVAIVAIPALTLILAWLVASTDLGAFGTLSEYLADPGRVVRRLSRLPSILTGAVAYAMPPGTFALAFAAPLVAGIALMVQRRRLGGNLVVAFVLAGLVAVLAAFLLSPEEDLDHHLRSSMSRLLLHWLGSAMLLAGVWSDALWAQGGPGEGADPR